MRTIILLAAMLSAWAQVAPPPGSGEVFTGTAQAKTAKASVSGTLEVRLRRLTPDFDRKAVETALKEGGYPRFLTALRNAPEVGQLVLGDGPPYAIRYAREKVDAGKRTIVVVTDKPVYFVGGGRADAAPRKGYEVGVLEIRLSGPDAGAGSLAAAARVRPDGDGGVVLDDFAEELITVSGITRKPS
jgi:hypothetical protein